jgi:hypothetical protein
VYVYLIAPSAKQDVPRSWFWIIQDCGGPLDSGRCLIGFSFGEGCAAGADPPSPDSARHCHASRPVK